MGEFMKRISILLVAVMVLSTVVASATPFKDVPFSHWAYDAVNKLAAKGILQGYPDGTFKGKQTVTRYALAMVTAKMLANVEQMLETGIGSNLVTKADLQTLEKLTVEFADELALLGVKVTALEDDMQVVKEDVSMLKRDVDGIKDYMAKGGMEKVKLSGDMLVRHTNLITNQDTINDNSRTESQIRFKFKANIDENITAVARWRMFTKASDMANPAALPGLTTSGFGSAGIGVTTTSNNMIDLAYLHIKDMFRFGGDFTFGRNLYAHGHSLLLNDYIDVVRYYKRSGDVDVVFQTIYDRHEGSHADKAQAVDFRGVWNLNLGTKYRDHDLYMGIYAQEEPNLANRRNPAYDRVLNPYPSFNLQPNLPINVGCQESDSRWDVEFGSKGPIGSNGHWDYDLGFAYTNYEVDIVNPAGNLIQPEMQGWMGHVAVKWDSRKEWAAKLAYTFADDESMGALAINNDLRYCDATETPYEDISRGNNYFANGLMNMGALKLQAEYRPRNTKHYVRVAGDFLNELDETVSNDLSKWQATHNTTAGIPAGFVMADSAYDRWNNFGTSDAEAVVFTFEYRYQLAENTRIRVGYTNFEMDGKETKLGATAASAGRNANGTGDYDYNMFWAEL